MRHTMIAVAAFAALIGAGPRQSPSSPTQNPARAVDATEGRYFVIDLGALGGRFAGAEGISNPAGWPVLPGSPATRRVTQSSGAAAK
jgi:hypothetical protein